MCVLYVCVCNFITWRDYVNLVPVSQKYDSYAFYFHNISKKFWIARFYISKVSVLRSETSPNDSFKWFSFVKWFFQMIRICLTLFIFVWLECTHVNTYESHCFFIYLWIKYRLISFVLLLYYYYYYFAIICGGMI